MTQRDIVLKSGSSFSAFVAAEFIHKASSFKSSVWVEKEEKKASAKSLLGVLALEITENDKVSVIADGVDESVAVKELVDYLILNV